MPRFIEQIEQVRDLAEIISEQHERFYLGDSSQINDVWDQYEDGDDSEQWLYKAREVRELSYDMTIMVRA